MFKGLVDSITKVAVLVEQLVQAVRELIAIIKKRDNIP